MYTILQVDSEDPHGLGDIDRVNYAKVFLKTLAAFAISFPTGFQNFLSELDIDLGSIKTWGQLFEEVEESEFLEKLLGAGSGLNSLLMNMAVNYINFSNSLRKTAKFFKMLFCCDINSDKKEFYIMAGSFVLALFPFFTYFSLGRGSFPDGEDFWTALPGYTFGALSGFSFFITRFNGLHWLFSYRRENKVLQRKIIKYLNSIHTDKELSYALEDTDESALESFLKSIKDSLDFEPHLITTRTWRPKALMLCTVAGFILGLNAAFVQPVVAYNTLNGFELLLNNTWFSEDNYQGGWQLFAGYLTSFMNSIFFYKIALYFPEHLLEFVTDTYNSPKSTKLLFIVPLILGLGAWSGQGMGGVAKSASDDGVLNYTFAFLAIFTAMMFKVFCWMGASIINADSSLVIFNNIFIKHSLWSKGTMNLEKAKYLVSNADEAFLKEIKDNGIEDFIDTENAKRSCFGRLGFFKNTENDPLLPQDGSVNNKGHSFARDSKCTIL